MNEEKTLNKISKKITKEINKIENKKQEIIQELKKLREIKGIPIKEKQLEQLAKKETKEIEKTINEEIEYKDPDDIDILIKKVKGFIKSRIELEDFQEPVLILIRRNGDIELKEGITPGEYEIEHSDGRKIKIFLPEKKMLRFRYGKDNFFKCFIYYEDEISAYPQEPLIDAELVYIENDKLKNDIREFELKSKRENREFVESLFTGVIWIIVAFIAINIISYLLTKQTIFDMISNAGTAKEIAQATTETIQQNVTNIN